MITFLGMPTRTSGEIRGRQISERLHDDVTRRSARFVDVHNPSWEVIGQNDVALFVRTWEPSLAREMVTRGIKVGYEIGDMPVGDAVFRGATVRDLSAYVHDECSFYVVNNSVQKKDLSHVTDKPSFVVPHHSANFAGNAAIFRTVPKRVGYVGLPEQLSARAELIESCRKHDVEFVAVHPNTREECDAILRTIDVGIVFAESDDTMRPRIVELMRRYKPNTKLTNFQAYGIPSVCTPYESFKEFGGDACVFVDTRKAFVEEVERLLTDVNHRLIESNRAFTVGKKFHVDVVKDLYLEILTKVGI